jgi:Ser/Thr protein kinase RdoA (MazF antagonist)
MSQPVTNLAARQVLSHYSVVDSKDQIVPLGNRGGFSGACIWRIEGPVPLCLRAWPARERSKERLEWIHQLMEQARKDGLSFVPAIFRTRKSSSWLDRAGRLWDLTSWMPGKADFADRPESGRLEAACNALARLHLSLGKVLISRGTCPAIERRLQAVGDWQKLVRLGWQPEFHNRDVGPVRPWAERAWSILPSQMEKLPNLLVPYTGRSWTLQPCLCDVWHDHVLFEGDAVSGIIDYGGMKTDHVAVDLARLLGSMAADNGGLRSAGLRAYRRLRSLSEEEEDLVRILDETGTIIGAANWLKWIYYEKRAFEDSSAVAKRLAALVRRFSQEGV